MSSKEINNLGLLINEHIAKNQDSSLCADYPGNLLYWEDQIYAWKYYTKPVRPSIGDLNFYKSSLEFLKSDIDKENSTSKKILILGSTPELRDIVAQLDNTEVYIVDFSYKMPVAMLRLTHFVDPEQEIWVRNNWLNIPFQNKFFDVILGDLVLQQFPPKLELVFLKKMSSLLNEKGRFITRAHFSNKKMQNTTIENIVQETLKCSLPYWEKFVLLKFQILWLFADLDKRLLCRHVSSQEFGEFVQQYGINNPLLNAVEKNLNFNKNSFRDWSPPLEDELLDLISKHFIILDKKNANDYKFTKYYPLYVLRSC